jgi:hypothetical protein
MASIHIQPGPDSVPQVYFVKNTTKMSIKYQPVHLMSLFLLLHGGDLCHAIGPPPYVWPSLDPAGGHVVSY